MESSTHKDTLSSLQKTLGLGFGLAVMVGSVIGVGILRTPGTVAVALQSPALIMAVWALGGVYVLLAIGSLAELATMVPKTGGAFVYAQAAFGGYAGFAVGWLSFLSNTIAPAFFSIVIGEYLVMLLPALVPYQTAISMLVLVLFTLFHLTGVRNGSLAQQITSFLKVLALLILIVFCFAHPATHLAESKPLQPLEGGFWISFFVAFQLVSGTYNGFAAPVFFAEEATRPSQHIPRALYGGAVLVLVMYLLINFAVLYVLPVEDLQNSKLALAQVAAVVLGEWGATLITLIALLSLLSILNAYLMIAPRILYGLSREGFFSTKGLKVNRKGTPTVVLLFTAVLGLLLIYVGSFEQLFAFSSLIEILVTMSLFASVIQLRNTQPNAPRPHKAFGYPYISWLMLLSSLGFLLGFLCSNLINSVLFFGLCLFTVPAFWWVRKS